MAKHLHPSATGKAGEERDIAWPTLPWTCPECRQTFDSHQETVATDKPDGSHQFFCMLCDIKVFCVGRSS